MGCHPTHLAPRGSPAGYGLCLERQLEVSPPLISAASCLHFVFSLFSAAGGLCPAISVGLSLPWWFPGATSPASAASAPAPRSTPLLRESPAPSRRSPVPGPGPALVCCLPESEAQTLSIGQNHPLPGERKGSLRARRSPGLPGISGNQMPMN